MSKTYTLADDLKPRIESGRWEHAEPYDMLRAVNHITMGGQWVTYGGWFRRPETNDAKWARYFLTSGQGGDLTGEALVFVYGGGGYYSRETPDEWIGTKPTAWKVAICKHQKAGGGTREQEQRGWHPGACALCGMDMTVDSGD